MIDAGPAQERDNFIGMTFIYLGNKQKDGIYYQRIWKGMDAIFF